MMIVAVSWLFYRFFKTLRNCCKQSLNQPPNGPDTPACKTPASFQETKGNAQWQAGDRRRWRPNRSNQ
jgi:hypothetical protein